jgi:uncharacterized protein YcbX
MAAREPKRAQARQARSEPDADSAAGVSFTDRDKKRVSLVKLATVEEIERRIGHPVAPLRFRGNLYVSGLPPWAGARMGRVDPRRRRRALRVIDWIDGCAATNVDPATGARDLNIPQALRRHYGHTDCGVLLRIVRGGRIHVGQVIERREPAEAGAG